MIKPAEVDFTAADTAPVINTVEQAATALIPDVAGRIALRGLRIDEHNSNSSVRVDTSTEPPTVHAEEALTYTVHGRTGENGEFIPHGGNMPEIPHKVTGTYAGPGSSDLEIS